MRAFRERHGVSTGSATTVAPALSSRLVTPSASSTSKATRMRGLGVPPASMRSIMRFCAGLASSRVARPASRIATRASPAPSNAAISGRPSASR